MIHKTKNDQPLTTAQRLGSLVKSARDIMRKDKGLNGDLDRLPMLTWLLFLKFLDDHEAIREDRAKMKKEKFRSVIEAPYRWRDWAAKEDGISGDALRNFINQEETVRPDGSEGPGLIAYLRGLQGSNGDDRRDVVRLVFTGVTNRMDSGYLLRDVINKVNSIHFDSTEEIHTLGHLYESMLKEMRDAAGDSGEFYTPRAVVRFMVTVTDPQLGEKMLDPACGTGGFLVETYSHLEKQCKTVQQRRTLQEQSIFGGEAKSLPYMLCQMNLLLHGLESPEIAKGNSLEQKLTEIKDSDRVDVILTNPPFGGEEEKGIQSGFPSDKQTSETALLFLQLIMRKLKITPTPGRTAVVVPNGTLFGDGVCARIKQELLTKFNLHTIVRLPNGVFSGRTESLLDPGSAGHPINVRMMDPGILSDLAEQVLTVDQLQSPASSRLASRASRRSLSSAALPSGPAAILTMNGASFRSCLSMNMRKARAHASATGSAGLRVGVLRSSGPCPAVRSGSARTLPGPLPPTAMGPRPDRTAMKMQPPISRCSSCSPWASDSSSPRLNSKTVLPTSSVVAAASTT
jgi:type I restriction enzyme M protein